MGIYLDPNFELEPLDQPNPVKPIRTYQRQKTKLMRFVCFVEQQTIWITFWNDRRRQRI